jgi:DNA-binding CsgD family transcriptional regulator
LADRHLSTQIDQWVELVDDLLHRPSLSSAWHRHVLPHMSETFDSPASWHWIRPDGRVGFEMMGMPADWPPPDTVELWAAELPDHPLLRWFAHTGDPAALTLSRVPTALVPQHEQDHTLDVLAESGLERQLSLPITLDGFVHEAFVLGRAGPDFSRRDMMLARQVQPLLRLVDRQAKTLAALRPNHLRPGDLTGRELSVLALLSQGMTAGAIGHRLGVSERTVHKHLQHLYRKLAARDRLSAVMTAHELGLLAPAARTGIAPCAEGLRIVNLHPLSRDRLRATDGYAGSSLLSTDQAG